MQNPRQTPPPPAAHESIGEMLLCVCTYTTPVVLCFLFSAKYTHATATAATHPPFTFPPPIDTIIAVANQ